MSREVVEEKEEGEKNKDEGGGGRGQKMRGKYKEGKLIIKGRGEEEYEDIYSTIWKLICTLYVYTCMSTIIIIFLTRCLLSIDNMQTGIYICRGHNNYKLNKLDV